MFEINEPGKEAEMAFWQADRRVYRSEDGRIVDEAFPGRKTLLYAAGRNVTEEDCRKYGLGPHAVAESSFDEEMNAGQGIGMESPLIDPGSEAKHLHYWRKDGTCRCGELNTGGVVE